MTTLIRRPATSADLAAVQEIERAAGELFRTVGMAEIADDEPIGAVEFAAFVADGGAWLSVDDHDRPVAYLLVERLDDAAHIEQVTVHPSVARHGIGAQLIARAALWAEERELSAVTLTTFRDVAWNAPYYARLGFEAIDPDEIGPGLRRRRQHEAEAGLTHWPRVAMRRSARPLSGRPGGQDLLDRGGRGEQFGVRTAPSD